MKISIILVTYNRMRFLPRALDSILSQTYSNFELILINNGSTDDTQNICKEYAGKDKRIKVINIENNEGASKGRNMGIDSASCEYITMVDDDDFAEKEMLEHLVTLANKHNADISICGSYNDYGDRLEPYFIFDELMILDKISALDELLKREKFNVAPPTKLFRRNLFKDLRFPENVLVDDIHIIYRAFANANIIVAKGIPLYHFTKHDSNMTKFIQSNNFSADLLDEYISMYKERTKYLIEKVPQIKERAIYSQWSYMISMCDKIMKYNFNNCEEHYNYMIEELKINYQEILNCSFITNKEIEKLKILLCIK